MQDADLEHGLGEGRFHRPRHAGKAVGPQDENVVYALLVELTENGEPGLGPFGALNPDAQHVALPILRHSAGQENALRLHGCHL